MLLLLTGRYWPAVKRPKQEAPAPPSAPMSPQGLHGYRNPLALAHTPRLRPKSTKKLVAGAGSGRHLAVPASPSPIQLAVSRARITSARDVLCLRISSTDSVLSASATHAQRVIAAPSPQQLSGKSSANSRRTGSHGSVGFGDLQDSAVTVPVTRTPQPIKPLSEQYTWSQESGDHSHNDDHLSNGAGDWDEPASPVDANASTLPRTQPDPESDAGADRWNDDDYDELASAKASSKAGTGPQPRAWARAATRAKSVEPSHAPVSTLIVGEGLVKTSVPVRGRVQLRSAGAVKGDASFFVSRPITFEEIKERRLVEVAPDRVGLRTGSKSRKSSAAL
jgi:hypothetical protein